MSNTGWIDMNSAFQHINEKITEHFTAPFCEYFFQFGANQTNVRSFQSLLSRALIYSMEQIFFGLDHWKYPGFDFDGVKYLPLGIKVKRSASQAFQAKLKFFIMECLMDVLEINQESRVQIITQDSCDFYQNAHMTFCMHYRGNYYRFRIEEFGNIDKEGGTPVRQWRFCPPIKIPYQYIH